MAVTPSQSAPSFPDAPTMPSLSQQLRLLFWLKWTLSFRGTRKSPIKLIGLILILVLLVPLSFALAAGVGFLAATIPEKSLFSAFSGAFFLVGTIWVLAPLIGFSLNESYDITRLFVFPIPVRRVFVGTILGSLADMSTLFVLPSALGIVIGLATRHFGAALVALIALPLFLFLTIAASQAILLLVSGLLKSRKFRDIAIVIAPLFWIGWQFLNQTYRTDEQRAAWGKVLQSPFFVAASYLPPGLTARSIDSAVSGNFGVSVLCLLGIGVFATGVIGLASWLVTRVYDGEEIGIAAPGGNSTKATAKPITRANASIAAPVVSRPQNPSLLDRLPDSVSAIARKEFLYFRRDPFFRVVAMNLLYVLVIAGFSIYRSSARNGGKVLVTTSGLNEWVAIFVIGGALSLALLQQSTLASNLFGVDGPAAGLLFSFPSPRRHLIWGKQIALAAALLPLNAILAVAMCAGLKRPDLIAPSLVYVAGTLPILLGVGAIFSVFFPYRVQTKGLRMRQQSTGYGFLYTIVWMLSLSVSTTLYLPVMAALGIPLWKHEPSWMLLTAPLALLYSAGAYFVAIKIAESWMLTRESEIVTKVHRIDAN